MYTYLADKIIFPFGDLAIGSSVMKYFYSMQKTQWWPSGQLRELQNTKLKELITYAYANVPYYRRVFEERGLTDKGVQTVEDLPKLPILTKRDIRQNFDSMLAKDYKKWKPLLDYTGGSTGEPLKFYITKDCISMNWAGIFRGWGWAGYKIGDKRITFGGSSLVPNVSPSIFEAIRDKLERNLRISAVSMNMVKYDECVRKMIKFRCKFIYGYPSAVYLLSDYCRSHNINDIHFNAFFSTAEVLLPNYRTAIENQFQCNVFDEYGTYDGGGQAMECGLHQGFHISAEKVIMEIVDENGKRLPPGKSGRIIVTDLHNYAMPFIRYEVGDTGMFADRPCICGRGLPILETIEGRTPDTIRLSNGVILSGAAVPCMLKNCHMKQYQLIQITKNELLLKIVKDIDYSERDTQYILNTLGHHVGKEIKIELEFSEQISVGTNSKYRFIISQI